MKHFFFVILFAVLTATLFAQNPKNIVVINSPEIFEKGTFFQDREEYEKSIQQFRKIPVGDSLYPIVQFKLSLSFYYLKMYDQAIQCLEYLLENPSSKIPVNKIYSVLGNIHFEKKEYLKAIPFYEKANSYSPYNFRLLTTLGKSYLEINQLDKAETAIKKALFCVPTYQYGHFLLGNLYLKQGKTIPAILAYNYVAFLNPKSDQAIEALQTLNELFVGFSEVVGHENLPEYVTDKLIAEDERFFVLEQIVANNLAITKNFKLKTKIDHILTRQTQLVFENLPASNGSKDILDYVYIPFYRAIMEKNLFDLYATYLLSGTNIEDNKVQEKAIKWEKKLKKVTDLGFTMLRDQVLYGIGVENNGNPKMEFEYNKDEDKIESFGGYTTINENGKRIYHGIWTILNDEGTVSAKIQLLNGKKNGDCYYFDNDDEIQKIPFRNDTIHGVALIYFKSENSENQILSSEIPMQNDQLNGIRKEFSRSGILLEEKEFLHDQLNGIHKLYDFHGHLSSNGTYKDGNPTGVFLEYYPNGVISSEINYDEDMIPFKKYYPDGKIKVDGTMVEGRLFGSAKSYFPNGKIETIGSYNENGEMDGFWTNYFKNGKVSEELTYNAGKLHGEHKIYTPSGFLTSKFSYIDGVLKEIITYLPDNNVREKIVETEGVFDASIYDENGTLVWKKRYDSEGNLTGISNQYFPNGSIFKTIPNDLNLKNGVETTYFNTGKIQSIITYKDDIEDGLSLLYYENDTLKSEGIYSNGLKNGIWYSYYINGAIETIDLFDNGKIIKTTQYNPDGNLKAEYLYNQNLIHTTRTYDNNNNIIKTDHFKEGNGTVYTYYLNGNIKTKGNVIANQYCDSIIEYDWNGNIKCIDHYISGLFNGVYQLFDLFSQKIHKKGEVLLNEFHGEVTSGSFNGLFKSIENYEYGSKEGEMEFYFNNHLFSTHHYLDNERDGISEYYSPSGKTVMYRFQFKNDQLISYSGMDKNQKMTDWKPISSTPVEIVTYYPNHQKSFEFSINNKGKQGKEISYYQNGQIFYECELIDNLAHGKSTYYFPNGKTQVSENYYFDLLHGKYQQYYDNGNLQIEGSFFYNIPHGTFKFFNNKGELTQETEFYYGNILTQKQ